MTARPFEVFAGERRWVAWRNEGRNGKLTKVPYGERGRRAKANDKTTWISRGEAEMRAGNLVNGQGGGIGLQLGELDGDRWLCGVDLDSCIDADDCLAPWAEKILGWLPTYAEKSPSGSGLKAFFFIAAEHVRPFLDLIGAAADGWGIKRGINGNNRRDHAPGVEIYVSHRFFAVTEQLYPGGPDVIRALDWDELQNLAKALPQTQPGKVPSPAGRDTSRSAAAFRLGAKMRRAGNSFENFVDMALTLPETREWTQTKGLADNSRELHRIWDKVDPAHPTNAWREKLLLNDEGNPRACEYNAMIALRGHPDMIGLFALDEFHQRSQLMRPPPWARPDEKFPRPVCDADLSDLLAWLQRQGIFLHGRAPMRIVLASIVRDVSFHPVRDYLSSLKWDRQPRLNTWLTYYLGVEPIENYTAIVGRLWMISAVARIFQPGCLAKYVLIIEGPQDLGKSSALRILGNRWFTDDIDTLGSKDSQMQVGNAWIIELAELDSTRRADINAIKAFISRPVDQFRPPYGEHIIRQERQSILAATVNPGPAYLHDETGAVRFWPVLATSIDLDALQHDRDQLWAEAVARYRDGECWWPVGHFKATEQQEARSETVESDPWFDCVEEWLTRQSKHMFKAEEILAAALEIPRERMDRRAERRLGAILRCLGYISGAVRIGDAKPVRRWRLKPTTAGSS